MPSPYPGAKEPWVNCRIQKIDAEIQSLSPCETDSPESERAKLAAAEIRRKSRSTPGLDEGDMALLRSQTFAESPTAVYLRRLNELYSIVSVSFVCLVGNCLF